MSKCLDCVRSAQLQGRRPRADSRSLGASTVDSRSRSRGDSLSQYAVVVEGAEWHPTAIAWYNMTVRRGAATWSIRRRFAQVDQLHCDLREELLASAGSRGVEPPRLPPKASARSIFFGPGNSGWLRQRTAQLERYFRAVLDFLPDVQGCAPLRKFLCASQEVGVDDSACSQLPSSVHRSHCESGANCVNCVICMESMTEHEDVRSLPCGHEYHYECIRAWLRQRNECCLCAGTAVLVPEESPKNANSERSTAFGEDRPSLSM